MTKMKSRKMTKSTFAIVIMAIAMVAMLAFGGTYAYFTSTAETAEGNTSTAVIKLTAEEGTQGKGLIEELNDNVLPGEEIFNVDVDLIDASTRNTYIFAKIEVKFGDTTVDLTTGKAGDLQVLDITWDKKADTTTTWASVDDVDNVFYIENTKNDDKAENAEATTYALAMKIELSENLHENFNTGDGETEDDLVYMGQAVTITIEFSAIQHKEFDTVADAYNAIATTVGNDANEPAKD